MWAKLVSFGLPADLLRYSGPVIPLVLLPLAFVVYCYSYR